MMRISIAIIIAVLMVVSAAPLMQTASSTDGTIDMPSVKEDAMGMGFNGPVIENKGQVDDDILFYTQGFMRMAFFDDHVSFVLETEEDGSLISTSFNMIFEGSGISRPIGLSREKGVYNFINEKGSFTNVNIHSGIMYPDIYNGMDLLFDLSGPTMKYEFHLQPFSDPDDILIEFEGISSLDIVQGELHIESSLGSLKDREPVSFQDGKEIRTDYRLIDAQSFGFDLDAYDRSKPIVVDPFLEASTFLGGSNWQTPQAGPMIDQDGNVVVSGYTYSDDFPTTPGALYTRKSVDADIYLSRLTGKLDDLIYSTFLGGERSDFATDIDLDEAGNIYLTGGTQSEYFPVTTGAFDETDQIRSYENEWGDTYYFDDAFVSCISNDGSKLLFSTYLGGNRSDYGTEIEVDVFGNIIISGNTRSHNFPAKNGYMMNHSDPGDSEYIYDDESTWSSYDGFLTKLDSTGSNLEYSTFFGGELNENQSGGDYVQGMVLDDDSRPILTGITYSQDFPTTSGVFEENWGSISDVGRGFVIKFNDAGSDLEWSTYLDINIDPMDIEEDSEGRLYITGSTDGNLTTTNDAFMTKPGSSWYDAFILILSSDGTALEHSTYLGGISYDEGIDLTLDNEDRPWIIGETSSTDFPNTTSTPVFFFNGWSCVFISHLDRNLTELVDGFLFGGSRYEYAAGIDIVGNTSIIIQGETSSSDFPFTEGAYDTEIATDPWGWADDTFISLIDMVSFPPGRPLEPEIIEGDSFLNISWSPPSHTGNRTILGYQVYRSTGSAYLMVGETEGNRLHFNDTDLINGNTYYYRIRSKNIVDLSPNSEMVNGTPAKAPSEPIIEECRHEDSSVNISWNRPEDDGGDIYMTYNLYMGSTGSELTLHRSGLDKYHQLVEGLVNGERYYFALTASNRMGEGPISEIVSSIPRKVPGVPLDLKAVTGDRSVVLDWAPPLDNGGDPDISYTMYLSTDNDSFTKYKKDLYLNNIKIDGLVNGRTYYFTVSASNSEGEGPRTLPVRTIPIGPPGTPMELTLESQDSSAQLSWDPPTDLGGDDIVSYNIYKGIHEEDMELYSEGIDVPRILVEGLENGIEVFFSVSAVNSFGEGEVSATVSTIPLGLPSAPMNLRVSTGDSVVFIEWEEPVDKGGCSQLTYQIFVGSSSEDLIYHSIVSSLSTSIEQLQNGKEHFFRIRAVNSVGESVFSDIVSAIPLGLPGAPSILFTEINDGSVTLTWSEPMDLGGSDSIDYSIYLWTDGPVPDSPWTQDIEDLSAVIDGLENGVKYNIAVAGVSTAGTGSLSNIVTAVPVGLPGSVEIIAVSEVDGSVFIEWKAPKDDGGESPVSYRIYRGVQGGSLELIDEVSGDLTRYTDRTVHMSVSYYYVIKAVNSAGEGEPSERVDIKTQGLEESTPAVVFIMIPIAVLIIIIAVLAMLVLGRKRSTRTLTNEQLRLMNEYEYGSINQNRLPTGNTLPGNQIDPRMNIPQMNAQSSQYLPPTSNDMDLRN